MVGNGSSYQAQSDAPYVGKMSLCGIDMGIEVAYLLGMPLDPLSKDLIKKSGEYLERDVKRLLEN
jgi:hypothetical protein